MRQNKHILVKCNKTTEASHADCLRFCVLLEGKGKGNAVLQAMTAYAGVGEPVRSFLTSELLQGY